MTVLRSLDRLIRWLVAVAVALAAVGMMYMATIGTADVVTYLVLLHPFPGANESVEVALAVTVAMTLAYTQYQRDHVVVDIVVQTFPPRGKKVSLALGLVTGFVCMSMLSWRSWELAADSVAVREAAFTLYSFPIYPWKIVFAAGLTLAAVEFLRQLVWMCLGDPNAGAAIHPENEEPEVTL
jgi:TRAP-type C4-dicarboxylate transport system permease small subunit